MDLPGSNSGESKPMAEAALVEEHRRMARWLEEKIQEFMLNGCQEAKLLLSSPYLRDIFCIFARHYGLEIISTDSTGLHFRRTPASRQPFLPPVEPGDGLSYNSWRQSGDALSGNLNEPQRRVTTLQEREEEYNKARGRNFNEPVPPGSTSAMASHSISDPVHGTKVREGGQDVAGGRRIIRNPVQNPGCNLNSNPISPRACIAEPWQPPLDPYGPSAFQSTLTPRFNSYNPGNSTYMQLPMPQSMQPQPRTEAAQLPSTNVAFRNQDVVYVPRQREGDETGRSGGLNFNARLSLQNFLINKKPE